MVMKTFLLGLVSCTLVLTFGTAWATPADACTSCDAIKNLQEVNKTLEQSDLPEDDRTQAGLKGLYAGLKDWRAVRTIQTGTAKEDFLLEYLKLSGQMMNMVPEPDPVECLGAIYDEDKALVDKQLNKLPPETKTLILKRLKDFDPVDNPKKKKIKKAAPAADAGPTGQL